MEIESKSIGVARLVLLRLARDRKMWLLCCPNPFLSDGKVRLLSGYRLVGHPACIDRYFAILLERNFRERCQPEPSLIGRLIAWIKRRLHDKR